MFISSTARQAICPGKSAERDDPVAVIGFVAQQRIETQPLDQRCHPHRIVTVTGQQDEAHQIAERICQCDDFGGPTAFRLAYSLTEGPPFEPCPAR